MILTQTFQINTPQVVDELFEDEVVIVNLDTGHYYSTEKVGAQIWGQLVKGMSVEQIMGGLLQKYDGQTTQIEASVVQFVEQLQKGELLVSRELSEQFISDDGAGATFISHNGFEPPLLVQYTDMEDLLMLDPIHDVDESGWPKMA